MAIVKQDKQVFFNGNSVLLNKGVEYADESAVVAKFPELFEAAKKVVKKVEKKVEAKKVELKEELLVEAPVEALEVTEEDTEDEEKPKRRKRK